MAVPGDTDAWEPGQHVSTDFYELYWAHLMSGTSWHHVIAWVQTLMLRPAKTVPSRLRAVWWGSWLLFSVIAAAALTYHSWKPDADKWPTIAVILGTAALLAKSTGSYLGLQYIGDAARYLSPTPANIGVRHDIRSAAIDLLEGLHEDPLRRYHRIVLVGHSLGSVIGYDALTHFWQRRHHPDASQLHPAAQPAHDRLQRPWSTEEGRELQRAVWREQHAIGVSWKITDFITLGSPLAHASFLLSAGPRDFDQRKGQRELPTCPPQLEDARDSDYGTSLLRAHPHDSTHECKLLHHAALFGCTRWTNVYFDGDLIGGPIQGVLGSWISDRRLAGQNAASHVHYWSDQAALAELRRALELDSWWSEDNAAVVLSSISV
jgi:hypothetical protein